MVMPTKLSEDIKAAILRQDTRDRVLSRRFGVAPATIGNYRKSLGLPIPKVARSRRTPKPAATLWFSHDAIMGLRLWIGTTGPYFDNRLKKWVAPPGCQMFMGLDATDFPAITDGIKKNTCVSVSTNQPRRWPSETGAGKPEKSKPQGSSIAKGGRLRDGETIAKIEHFFTERGNHPATYEQIAVAIGRAAPGIAICVRERYSKLFERVNPGERPARVRLAIPEQSAE